MRLKLVLGLLVAAVVFPMTSAHAIVPRAGATCSKVGQSIDYQGKRYTCIKSGAKRVWNKGVAIKVTSTPSARPSLTASPSASATASPSSSPTSGVREFTLAQLSTHNSSSSCWSAINGDVYDLTTWIGQHPGGAAAIQRICGVDGTNAFNNQHEGSGKVARQLSQFYIGRLKS